MESQFGKVEADVHLKASVEEFHGVFCSRTHHIANVTPEKVQGVEIHEGEWGTEGSIIFWKYVNACVAKEFVKSLDRENKITFKVLEGELLEAYKSFKFILDVTPQEKGSVVHWTVEYEKLKDHIPDPYSLLLLGIEVSQEIDAHLTLNQK